MIQVLHIGRAEAEQQRAAKTSELLLFPQYHASLHVRLGTPVHLSPWLYVPRLCKTATCRLYSSSFSNRATDQEGRTANFLAQAYDSPSGYQRLNHQVWFVTTHPHVSQWLRSGVLMLLRARVTQIDDEL
jgi:hypothetical protein